MVRLLTNLRYLALSEKVDYYAHDKKVARHEATRRYQLLALKTASPTTVPLLPILDTTPSALNTSPLLPLAINAMETGQDEDDAATALLNPTGPWTLEHQVHVPDCSSNIHFTTKHSKTNMTVSHWLKVVFRVERGGPSELDAKGKPKQFDIIM